MIQVLARMFHISAKTASGCSRRRQSALTSFPPKSPLELFSFSAFQRFSVSAFQRFPTRFSHCASSGPVCHPRIRAHTINGRIFSLSHPMGEGRVRGRRFSDRWY